MANLNLEMPDDLMWTLEGIAAAQHKSVQQLALERSSLVEDISHPRAGSAGSREMSPWRSNALTGSRSRRDGKQGPQGVIDRLRIGKGRNQFRIQQDHISPLPISIGILAPHAA